MVRFAFKKGLRFLHQTSCFTLLKRLANGNFQLEDQGGEICSLTESQIHTRWSTGEWQIDEESLGSSSNVFYHSAPRDLKTLPEAHQVIAIRKFKYLDGIKKLFGLDQSVVVSSPSKGVSEFLCVRRNCLPPVLGKRISS